MTKAELRSWLAAVLLLAPLVALASSEAALKGLLGFLFPGAAAPLYPRAGLAFLLGEHLGLVAVSSALAALVGIAAGVLATRPGAEAFAELAERLAAAGQTFPPAAVLALAVPSLGFGFAPTIVALFLYGIPARTAQHDERNRRSRSARSSTRPGAWAWERRGCYSRSSCPWPRPSSSRGSAAPSSSTSARPTVGATIGAGGLGSPIISGLVTQNPSYLAEGAIAVALLALAVDALFAAAVSHRLSGARRLSEQGDRGSLIVKAAIAAAPKASTEQEASTTR